MDSFILILILHRAYVKSFRFHLWIMSKMLWVQNNYVLQIQGELGSLESITSEAPISARCSSFSSSPPGRI